MAETLVTMTTALTGDRSNSKGKKTIKTRLFFNNKGLSPITNICSTVYIYIYIFKCYIYLKLYRFSTVFKLIKSKSALAETRKTKLITHRRHLLNKTLKWENSESLPHAKPFKMCHLLYQLSISFFSSLVPLINSCNHVDQCTTWILDSSKG